MLSNPRIQLRGEQVLRCQKAPTRHNVGRTCQGNGQGSVTLSMDMRVKITVPVHENTEGCVLVSVTETTLDKVNKILTHQRSP
jgi:hypothetical protein